jgi:hypothetical protein
VGGIPRGTLWELWSGRGRRGDDHPAYRMRRGASRPRGGMHVARVGRGTTHRPAGGGAGTRLVGVQACSAAREGIEG